MQIIPHYIQLLLFSFFSLSAIGAYAQSYPNKTIHIHTAGAGATSDFIARLLANELTGALGQSVVVENRPAGNILVTGVAKSAPDGYTLLLWGGGLWLAPLFEEAPYDVGRDFVPIAALGRQPNILVVTSSLPAKTVAELVKLAKAKPGELNYSSGASGSTTHIAGELFKSLAGVDIVRVAYKSQADENSDLMSGQIHMSFTSAAASAAQIKSGKLRALATTGSKRSALLPDLPTVAETVPGYLSEPLIALWAPAKTPDAIVRRLNQETSRALEKPDVRERMLKIGQEPVGGTPESLAETARAEVAKTGKLIKDIGLKIGG